MNYLFYAITCQLFYAIGIIFDKIITNKYIKDPITLASIFSIINFLPFIFIFPFIKISVPNFKIIALCILAGSLMPLSFIPYFKSLLNEEASRVAPLWYLSPVFVLIMAFIFLGEKLTLSSYVGFFLVLFGGLLICTRKIKDIFRVRKTFFLMLAAGFIFSISEILTKFIYGKVDYWTGIFWILFGSSIGGLLLLVIKEYRKNFTTTIYNINKNSVLLLLGAFFGGFLGRVLYFLAIMLGSVSLVAVVGGFEGLFVLVYAILLSKHLPKLFKEEIDKKTITHKIIAIFLMFIGLVFIYI